MGDQVCWRAPLWQWVAAAGGTWHFLTIEGEGAEAIAAHALVRRLESGRARGFGSVRVAARIGATCWTTSVFPSREGGWWLPVKSSVRRAEDIAAGDEVEVSLEML